MDDIAAGLDFPDRINRGQDVRLGAPEGGQPQRGQPPLQRGAEVTTSEGKIMSSRIAYRVLARVAMPGIVGCLGLAPFFSHPVTAENPILRFGVFFAGHTQGKGTLELLTGRRLSLQVEGHGHTEADGSFRLDQIVTFEDGAVEKRTWRLVKRNPGTYTGKLSNAVGTVSVEETGNRLHLRYLVRQPAVYMEQHLYLLPDGRTILNLATITVIGLPWARLTEEITRVDDREQESEN